MGQLGLSIVALLILGLAISGCRNDAPQMQNKASAGALLPRESILSLATVKEVLAEMSQETATGKDDTAVGNPVDTRSVTYATPDGSQRVVISIDQFPSSQDASAAFEQAYQASQKVPGVKGESVPDLGQRAFIGIVTQGKETHVGDGALYDENIVTETLQVTTARRKISTRLSHSFVNKPLRPRTRLSNLKNSPDPASDIRSNVGIFTTIVWK